jgi:hypothetical protein
LGTSRGEDKRTQDVPTSACQGKRELALRKSTKAVLLINSAPNFCPIAEANLPSQVDTAYLWYTS